MSKPVEMLPARMFDRAVSYLKANMPDWNQCEPHWFDDLAHWLSNFALDVICPCSGCRGRYSHLDALLDGCKVSANGVVTPKQPPETEDPRKLRSRRTK